MSLFSYEYVFIIVFKCFGEMILEGILILGIKEVAEGNLGGETCKCSEPLNPPTKRSGGESAGRWSRSESDEEVTN